MRKLRILSKSYVYCKCMRYEIEDIEKYQYSSNNSAMACPTRLIFVLERDIDVTILGRKFHHNRISLSEVIVYTNRWTDTSIDSINALTFPIYLKKCEVPNLFSITYR